MRLSPGPAERQDLGRMDRARDQDHPPRRGSMPGREGRPADLYRDHRFVLRGRQGRDDHRRDAPGPAHRWRNYYARAKALSEQVLMELHREQGLPVVIFRPGIVIGRGGSPLHWGIGMWSFDAVCQLWGRGTTPLPLVLVEDVASALVAALELRPSKANRSIWSPNRNSPPGTISTPWSSVPASSSRRSQPRLGSSTWPTSPSGWSSGRSAIPTAGGPATATGRRGPIGPTMIAPRPARSWAGSPATLWMKSSKEEYVNQLLSL